MNVEFQTRVRVEAREMHFAGGNLEVPVNEVDQPMRQVTGKVRPVVRGPILHETSRDVYTGIFFVGQLDVGKSFVIAQQNVEAWLPLLDEIVLERQRFFVVVDQNVLDVT